MPIFYEKGLEKYIFQKTKALLDSATLNNKAMFLRHAKCKLPFLKGPEEFVEEWPVHQHGPEGQVHSKQVTIFKQ